MGPQLGAQWVGNNTVTSYYVNRGNPFPVNLRLSLQVNGKYEEQVRQKQAQQWLASPTLAHNRPYLATLISHHDRQKTYRSKTTLGGELMREAIEWPIPSRQ